VQIDVAGNIVEIAWAGYEAIVGKFEAAGASRPVSLFESELRRLRAPLEFWNHAHELTDGLARLLAALVQADSDGQADTRASA
jgi:hypothetical protein